MTYILIYYSYSLKKFEGTNKLLSNLQRRLNENLNNQAALPNKVYIHLNLNKNLSNEEGTTTDTG